MSLWGTGNTVIVPRGLSHDLPQMAPPAPCLRGMSLEGSPRLALLAERLPLPCVQEGVTLTPVCGWAWSPRPELRPPVLPALQQPTGPQAGGRPPVLWLDCSEPERPRSWAVLWLLWPPPLAGIGLGTPCLPSASAQLELLGPHGAGPLPVPASLCRPPRSVCCGELAEALLPFVICEMAPLGPVQAPGGTEVCSGPTGGRGTALLHPQSGL